MKKIYIFGSGISGATIARLAAEKNFDVTLFEKRGYIGGNCYDYKNFDKILVHKFGPHIFHTSNEEVNTFVRRFCTLNGYENRVLVDIDGELYPMPFNFESIDLLYNDKEGSELKEKLIKLFPGKLKVSILEMLKANDEQISEFANFLYQNIYANYTAKMWGTTIEKIDPNTINRVGISLNYSRSYFPDDKYQGLPIGGYSKMVKKILSHKNIKLLLKSKQDTLQIKDNKIFIKGNEITEPVFYCGPLDELFSYKFGRLPFRSLFFKFETIDVDSYQQSPIINYPNHPTMTRIAEYKKLTMENVKGKTTISREYPGQFDEDTKEFSDRYYPIINEETKQILEKYLNEVKKISNIYPLGRLAEYKYYDMDDAIEEAMKKFSKLF